MNLHLITLCTANSTSTINSVKSARGEKSNNVELDIIVFGWTYISSCFTLSSFLSILEKKKCKIRKGRKVQIKWNSSWWCSDELISHQFLHSKREKRRERMDRSLTYEECRVRHRRHLWVRRRFSHRWWYVRDRCRGNIGMGVFVLRQPRFRVPHRWLRWHLCRVHQACASSTYVGQGAIRCNMRQHSWSDQVSHRNVVAHERRLMQQHNHLQFVHRRSRWRRWRWRFQSLSREKVHQIR